MINFKDNATRSQKVNLNSSLPSTFADIEIMVKKTDYIIFNYENSSLTSIVNYLTTNHSTIILNPDPTEDSITVVKINYLIYQTEYQKSIIRDDFRDDTTKFLIEIKDFEYAGFEYVPGTTPNNDTELWFARDCCVGNEIDDKITESYPLVIQGSTLQS